MDKQGVKEKVEALVKFYNSKKGEFDKLSESDIRRKLIDKLFGLLGWDLEGDERPDEVQREETIEGKESKKKKADYVFRIWGVPKFVVEAKAIKVNLDNEDFQKQIVGYSFNLACSWGILTNFIETKIYFVDDDNRVVLAIKDLSDLNEFENNFEKLWFLSRESAKDDLLGKDLEKRGIKPKKVKVDKQLYSDLKIWRKKLSEGIKKDYTTKYDSYVIEEIVQRIIDRLIFIRKLEDMELEERKLYQLTRRFSSETKYYGELKKIFEYYRDKYNSGLFGEKEAQECDRIDIPNNIIESVIKGLYLPQDRKIEYNFAVIDADILGNIYEQYLSFILKETPKRTKLEGGVAHRKEQGIYYTPTYIVDYIVKNAVVNYIKDKSIDKILEIKILDPACGSGSFLIRAFSEICKIIEKKLKKGGKSEKSISLSNYSGRLTLQQKITILLSCIHGVDLDKKAVEIAQLNLLLKLLEGETAESISMLNKTKKLLPMLNNIKCGDSLIDNPTIAENKSFKWEEKFPFKFDVVIGNPPYFNIRTNLQLQNFCRDRYPEIYNGQNDVLFYFVLKGLNLLKEGGNLGFIVSRYFLESDSAKKFREFMLKNSEIIEIIDFGNNQVFEGANVLTSLIILRKTEKPKDNKIIITKFKDNQRPQLISELSKDTKGLEQIKINQNELTPEIWTFYNPEIAKVISKIETGCINLSEIAKTGAGIQSGLNDVFVVNKETIEKYRIENAVLRNYIKTRDIKPYRIIHRNLYVIRLTNKEDINKFPNTKKYLLEHEKALKNRYEAKKNICEWYSFAVSRNLDIFDSNKEKIITPIYSTSNKFSFDSGQKSENYLTLSDTVVIQVKTNYPTKVILGILNSKMMNFYYKKTRKLKREGYYEYLSKTIETLPIKQVFDSQQQLLIKLVDKILSFNKRLNDIGDQKIDERVKIEEEIKKTGAEIDKIVYDLYGITKEEQEIIEENSK